MQHLSTSLPQSLLALRPPGAAIADSDDEQELVGALSSALTVVDDFSFGGLATASPANHPTLPGTKVHDIELAAEKVRAELAVQQRMLAPTSCEHVFATALLSALGAEDGKQNLKNLQSLREYATREAQEHPERWTNQHAAQEIDRIAAEREQLIRAACDRVFDSLLTSAAPAQGTAALEALAQCRRLKEVVVLPEAVLARLEQAYEQCALVVLQAIVGMLSAHLKSVQQPRSLLDVCDPRWLRGTLDAEALGRLRQLVQVAESAVSMANFDGGDRGVPHRGAAAEFARLRASVAHGVGAVRRLLAQAAEDATYATALRVRCRRVQLPQPEEWLGAVTGASRDGGDAYGGRTLALETIVGFAERGEAALQQVRGAHRLELDGYAAQLGHAQSAAGAQSSAEREQLVQRAAALEAANAQQRAEIERLTGLLTAARVPFSSHSSMGGGAATRERETGLSALALT